MLSQHGRRGDFIWLSLSYFPRPPNIHTSKYFSLGLGILFFLFTSPSRLLLILGSFICYLIASLPYILPPTSSLSSSCPSLDIIAPESLALSLFLVFSHYCIISLLLLFILAPPRYCPSRHLPTEKPLSLYLPLVFVLRRSPSPRPECELHSIQVAGITAGYDYRCTTKESLMLVLPQQEPAPEIPPYSLPLLTLVTDASDEADAMNGRFPEKHRLLTYLAACECT